MKKKIFVILLSLVVSLPCFADLQQMATETQRIELNGKNMKMIWWIPNEYWVESAKKNPEITEQTLNNILSVVEKYTVVAVVDGVVDEFGRIKAKSYQDIASNLIVEVDGEQYHPIEISKLNQDTVKFFNAMKPVMGSMLGQFGNGMEFFAFEGVNEKEERLLDPTKEKRFIITLEKPYQYRLPLGSLLPEKIDPETKEKFPGNYRFNPFTGSELTLK